MKKVSLQERENLLMQMQENILKNNLEIQTLLKELKKEVSPSLNQNCSLKSLGDLVIARSEKIQELQKRRKAQEYYTEQTSHIKYTLQGKK
jgi:hypothetical protein